MFWLSVCSFAKQYLPTKIHYYEVFVCGGMMELHIQSKAVVEVIDR